MRRIPLFRLSAAALLVAVGACTSDGPVSSMDDRSPVIAAAYIDGTGISPDPNDGGFRSAGVADVELFEVCKRWVGTPGVATFEVDDGVTTNSVSTDDGTWTAANVSALGHDDWSCRDVYIIGGSGTTVRVTETGTTGANPYTLTDVSALSFPGAATIGSDYVEGLLAGTPGAGVTAFFTNTEMIPLAEGRMTGGGVKAFGVTGDGEDVRVTLGLTLHCDNLLSNNLEVNWPHRQRWHIEKESLTSVMCTLIDDPTPPVAPISRFEATAVGRLNGGDFDSLIEFVFEDLGEPGRNDRIQMTIYPGMDNTATPVLTVSTQNLAVGNFQMHYDQPHGQKPNR